MKIYNMYSKKPVLKPDYLSLITFKYKANSLAIFPDSTSYCQKRKERKTKPERKTKGGG